MTEEEMTNKAPSGYAPGRRPDAAPMRTLRPAARQLRSTPSKVARVSAIAQNALLPRKVGQLDLRDAGDSWEQRREIMAWDLALGARAQTEKAKQQVAPAKN